MSPSAAWAAAFDRCPIGSVALTHYWGPAACKCRVPVAARLACPVRSLDPTHYTTDRDGTTTCLCQPAQEVTP